MSSSKEEAKSSKDASSNEGPSDAKQARLLNDEKLANQKQAEPMHDFSKFRLVEVLDSSQRAKYVALLGKYDNTDDSSKNIENGDNNSSSTAILLLEKEAFPVEQLRDRLQEEPMKPLPMFDDKQQSVETVMHNDIWHKYRLPLAPSLSLAKATLVHPATDRLVAKYRRRPCHLVVESPEDYARLTETTLAKAGAKHSLAWVGNLLDGTAEQDRLIFDDPDPNIGFVLHADLKWDARRIDDLYCLAVCRLTGLHSMRQLRQEHLPVLENLLNKGRKALRDRYNVPISQQRVFLHYQPSFYHLHAHFTHVSSDWPGQQCERAHPLTDIINNIRLLPDYYQRATLTFTVKEGEPLYEAYKDQLDVV